MVPSSAHERTTSDRAANGKLGSPRQSKRIREIKSAHESTTRNGPLEDDDDDDDGFGQSCIPGRKPGTQDYDRVRFSSLFGCDSFTGTFPLGGMGESENDDEGLGLMSTRSLEPQHTRSSSGGNVGASPLSQTRQPRKSAMRKPAQASLAASSLSSLSMIPQHHANESPPMMANMAVCGPTRAASVSNMPVKPFSKRMEERWESDLPHDSKSQPSTSPKVPGRVRSEGSVSLAAVSLPLTKNESEITVSKNAARQKDMAPGELDGIGDSKEREGSLSNKLSEDEVIVPSRARSGPVLRDAVGVLLPQKLTSDVPTPPAEAYSDPATCGVMALNEEKVAFSTVYKPRRRGSTGVLAQKWEAQFPSKTPILPQSAPTTPKDSARKRFNHRRRGSFGIYANVSNDYDDPVPPKIPPVSKVNGEDEYDVFLQSGATGDFATWQEQHRKEKEMSTSISHSIHRKSLLPPTHRRGSTGALAQRWEQELLPALQATTTTATPPLTPTSISSRRGSASVREKLRQFGSLTQTQSERSSGVSNGDPRVLDEVSPSRRDSKRRGSMAALVEKWEKLTTPAASPKDNDTTSNVSLSTRVDGCNDIPFNEDRSERCEPSAIDVTSKPQAIGDLKFSDDPPDLIPCDEPKKPVATKHKRRGSTGALATKIKKEPKEGQIAKTTSGKIRIRGGSIGHVEDKPVEKKKKSHGEKATAKSPSKKKAIVELRMDDVSISSLQSREQVAGQGSMEEASHKSLKTSPKIITKHYPETKGRRGSTSSTTKVKAASKNDMDVSKGSTDSHALTTGLTASSELDSSKRRTTGSSQSRRSRSVKVSADSSSKTGTTTTTGMTTPTTATSSTKIKKRSNSVGAIKVKSKKSIVQPNLSRGQSASGMISAADSQRIKQKKHLPGKLHGVEAEGVTVV